MAEVNISLEEKRYCPEGALGEEPEVNVIRSGA